MILNVHGLEITLEGGKLRYGKYTGSPENKKKIWERIKKRTSEIKSYLKTFASADKLADYIDGGEKAGSYEDRIERMPELEALAESLRVSEMAVNGSNLHDKAMADRVVYLEAFSGLKTYQTFADNPDIKSKSMIRVIHDTAGLSIGSRKILENLNKHGAGVYLTVNETDGHGRRANNVSLVRAVFADLDGAPLHPVWEYEPSMVVESSPGKYHAYWLTDDKFPLDGFTQTQKAIARTFNSDEKVNDLSRVMRVPGFMHNKATPFLTRIIHYSGEVYDFGRLTEMFPPPVVEKWSAPMYQKVKKLDNDGEFKGTYGASEGNRNNHVTKRVGGMISKGLPWPEIENEAMKEGIACSPPLSEKEVNAVLKSCRRYV